MVCSGNKPNFFQRIRTSNTLGWLLGAMERNLWQHKFDPWAERILPLACMTVMSTSDWVSGYPRTEVRFPPVIDELGIPSMVCICKMYEVTFHNWITSGSQASFVSLPKKKYYIILTVWHMLKRKISIKE